MNLKSIILTVKMKVFNIVKIHYSKLQVCIQLFIGMTRIFSYTLFFQLEKTYEAFSKAIKLFKTLHILLKR